MINEQFEACKVCGRDKKYSLAHYNAEGKMVHVNGCSNFCDSELKPRVKMYGSNPVYKEYNGEENGRN